MALEYPYSCFSGLVGIAGACAVPTIKPVANLQQIPAITVKSLSELANEEQVSGEKMGISLIESAASFLTADVLGIYDAAYKVVPSLVNGCSACSFSANTYTGSALGTTVKNLNASRMARLIIQSIKFKPSESGTFTIVFNDGITTHQIQDTFLENEEAEIININFSTKAKFVRIYVAESVTLPKLSCPSGSGCGCSGKVAHQSDLVFTGTAGGSETAQAYGILPCAYIGCNSDDVLCSIAQQAPIVVGQTLLYKAAELYHQLRRMSARNNRSNVTNPEDLYRDERHWAKQYENKLNGIGTRGLKDVVNDLLRQSNDACVTCDARFQTAGATG